MEEDTLDIADNYRAVGLREGDVVFVHANLLPFGLVAKEKEKFVEFFLDPLLQIIGPTGTIVLMSYTFDYAKGVHPYIHESTSSEAGMLSEYVRRMPGAQRSFHPLCSVVAYGAKASDITKDASRSAFGWGSPFHRLHELKAKCLFLGMTCGQSFTFLHYVEQMYGVSHCYNKAFFHPAFKDGKEIAGPFLAFLRNRKSEPFDFAVFERRARERRVLSETSFQGAPIQSIAFVDTFRIGMELLEENPSIFLKTSFFVTE